MKYNKNLKLYYLVDNIIDGYLSWYKNIILLFKIVELFLEVFISQEKLIWNLTYASFKWIIYNTNIISYYKSIIPFILTDLHNIIY